VLGPGRNTYDENQILYFVSSMYIVLIILGRRALMSRIEHYIAIKRPKLNSMFINFHLIVRTTIAGVD